MKRFFILSLALLGITAGNWFWDRHVVLGGKIYPRNATVLVLPEAVPAQRLRRFHNLYWVDLRGRGLTGAEYEEISHAAGDARILWELDFQGTPVPSTAREIQVEHLSDEEVEALDYLPRLRLVRGDSCRDYPQLLALRKRRPDCQVNYRVELGGVSMSCWEGVPSPNLCTEEDIRQALALLPRVRRVDLRETGLSPEQARRLARDYPSIFFLWEETWGDARFSTDQYEIDLSGVQMEDTARLEAMLPYLKNVRKIILCDCGLESPVLAQLGERYPAIRFVWRVRLGPLSARTDDTWFAPITKGQLIGGHDVDELKYCTDMECIDLGHCWIRDCEWARGMKNLRYLVLADTYVRDLSPLSELKNLTYLELFVTPVRDYSPLLGCTGLEDLNLGYTYGDPTPISQMSWLKNLWWGGIHYVPWPRGENPAAMLRNGLPDTRITLYAGSSTGMGWRNLPHYYEMRDRIGMYYMTG